MENVITISKTWEKTPKGYLATFIKYDRKEDKILNVAYLHNESFADDKEAIKFASFEEVENFLNS